MGSNGSKPTPPPTLPIASGKVRICIAGFKLSTHTGRARHIAVRLANMRPDLFETWFYFDSSDNYYAFLADKFANVTFPDHLKGHDSSPFVWVERGEQRDITPIGGRTEFCGWLTSEYADVVEAGGDEFKKLVTSGPDLLDAFHCKEEWQMTAPVA